MEHCKECGKEVLPIDMSLTKLLINRGTLKYYCKKCLSEKFNISEKMLDDLVEYKKKQGCSLFV